MVKIVWTEPALEELEGIAEYIAISNYNAASSLVARIFVSVERLSEFPESGRLPQELPYLTYREVIVNPCRVFYKFEQDNVYILHVLRQERDMMRYLINEGMEIN